MGMKQKKCVIFLKNKNKMADSKKLSFSTLPKAEQQFLGGLEDTELKLLILKFD